MCKCGKLDAGKVRRGLGYSVDPRFRICKNSPGRSVLKSKIKFTREGLVGCHDGDQLKSGWFV